MSILQVKEVQRGPGGLARGPAAQTCRARLTARWSGSGEPPWGGEAGGSIYKESPFSQQPQPSVLPLFLRYLLSVYCVWVPG